VPPAPDEPADWTLLTPQVRASFRSDSGAVVACVSRLRHRATWLRWFFADDGDLPRTKTRGIGDTLVATGHTHGTVPRNATRWLTAAPFAISRRSLPSRLVPLVGWCRRNWAGWDVNHGRSAHVGRVTPW